MPPNSTSAHSCATSGSTARLERLKALQNRIIDASGHDDELGSDILWLLVALPSGRCREIDGRREHNTRWFDNSEDPDWRGIGLYFFGSSLLPTADLNAAVELVNRVLPGWWWSVGTCCVSDDARIGPDYNSPIHGKRLKREFPFSVFDSDFDIDRRPPGNVALALLEALFDALIYIEQQKIANGEASNG